MQSSECCHQNQMGSPWKQTETETGGERGGESFLGLRLCISKENGKAGFAEGQSKSRRVLRPQPLPSAALCWILLQLSQAAKAFVFSASLSVTHSGLPRAQQFTNEEAGS